MVLISEPRAATSSELVRAPRQRRSERTLARIGSTLMVLLAEKSFDEITIDDVVRRSRTSVGSFYARFSGKDALLRWFDATYFAASRQAVARELDPDRWVGVPLAPMVRRLTLAYVRFLRQHEHLLRVIALEIRARPGAQLHDRSQAANLAAHARFEALLLLRRNEIHHPDPEFGVLFAVTQMFAASHELLLFARSGLHPVQVSDERLAEELARGMLGYLGVREPRNRRAS